MLQHTKKSITGYLSYLMPCIALISQMASAQSVYVPLNHWAYEFVERMEAQGLIYGALNGTKPYSRAELTEYLIQLEQRLVAGESLNPVEQRQLEFLRFEFREEFEQLTGSDGYSYTPRIRKIKDETFIGKLMPSFVYRNNRNFIQLGSPALKMFIDPIFAQRALYANPDSIAHRERVFERSHGLNLRGTLGTHLGFVFNFRDTKEWGSRDYPDVFDISLERFGFVNGYATHIWHDETVSYVVFKLPYFQFIFGKDSNYWGPGFRGALSLSDYATSYDQIKLQSKLWRLKFTYIWGILRTFPVLRDQNDETSEKSFVAHRLDIDVTKWLDIGLYEMVVYGERRFELAYLNPINFYRSAEHALADNDNATLGADLELLLIPNVKLYAELFIDDLYTSRIGSGWFGDKTAWTAGGLWVNALGVPNLDVRTEYTRIRPFVYTHEKQINIFSHFSTGLGHWLGPNSDSFYTRLQYRLSKCFFMAADFESTRHGANSAGQNVGGDIHESQLTRVSDYIDFLSGERERQSRVGLELSYEVYRNFYIELQLNRSSSQNILLADNLRGRVRRDEIAVSLSLNR